MRRENAAEYKAHFQFCHRFSDDSIEEKSPRHRPRFFPHAPLGAQLFDARE